MSLLTSTSKLFEKIVFNQLYDYFHENQLFHSSQYGFRKLHSTELAALELTDRILKDVDERNISMAIFMDLSKAFDTLDHQILLKKVNFLWDRRASPWLGPLLFLIYMDDITNASEAFEYILYADDTTFLTLFRSQ